MGNFNDYLKRILNYAFSKCSTPPFNEKDYFADYLQILNLKDNKIFIDRNNPSEYIYILISGITYVANYTHDGRRIIADSFAAPQIFGLIEAINNDSHYKGTVITLSNTILVKVNKDKFLEAMYSDLEIASFIIKYLANFSTHSMKTSQYKTTISPYENLVIYLYNKVLGKKLPDRIKDNKSFIADSLQIDKRTLYRYLNRLTEEGIISRDRQDIIISFDNFKKIEELFNIINNF